MSCKHFQTVKLTLNRAQTAKTDGLSRKTLQKVLKNRKNRDFGYSDGFRCKRNVLKHFPQTTRLLKHSLDVLQAFPDHETHCIQDAGN